MGYTESVLLLAAMIILAAATCWRTVLRLWRGVRFEKARALFHRERERLEARLVKQIAVPVVTGEMEWLDCEFDNQVTFLRDRRTGGLVALVGVMLGPETSWTVELDEQSRGYGVAIFRFDNNHWRAEPKIHMNATPDDIIRGFSKAMEVVRRDTARQGQS
ncbi:MAG: hypothetical protein ACUVQG_02465 [Thermogutta sp.]